MSDAAKKDLRRIVKAFAHIEAVNPASARELRKVAPELVEAIETTELYQNAELTALLQYMARKVTPS